VAYSFTNSRGKTYILHAKARTLKSGKQGYLYYFASTQKEGALDAVPEGYQVIETKNGLPVLKRSD